MCEASGSTRKSLKILKMKEEGVPVFRNRFGFARPSTAAYSVTSTPSKENNPSRIQNNDKSLLKKIEHFNSNKVVDARPNKSNNFVNKGNIWVGNENKTHETNNKAKTTLNSPKLIQKNPPKKIDIKNEVFPTSLPRKPIFVNKYSPYKSDTDKQKQSAPLIMTAESEADRKKSSSPSLTKRNNLYQKKQEFMMSTPKPSQLPGLRSSLFNPDQNKLNSATLHSKNFSPSNYNRAVINKQNTSCSQPPKVTTRNFASYKNSRNNNTDDSISKVAQSRKWVLKKVSNIEHKANDDDVDKVNPVKKEIEFLQKLKESNKKVYDQARTISALPKPNILTPIPQDVEICDDCSGEGGATETEDDSGIFTSSYSKHSIDDEMIETDTTSPIDLKEKPLTTVISNFGSDSEEICSRETSPMQLLADLLRKKSPEIQETEDRINSGSQENVSKSLVKLRKLQFEKSNNVNERKFVTLKQDKQEAPSSVDLNKISHCLIGGNQNDIKDKHLDLTKDIHTDDKMVSSLVSNTSRLSICTDCTGGSDENENKFFDDDYTDQQQLILNNQEENSYNDRLFDRVDSFLLSKQEEQEDMADQVDGDKPECEPIQKQVPQTLRVQQIIEEESKRESKRKTSENTLSSIDSDLCMLDLEENFQSDDSQNNSRAVSPVRLTAESPILNDVRDIKDLLQHLQIFLSQEGRENDIKEENADLKRQISILKLQLAEKDRRIEMLQRRMEQKLSLSLSRLTNIATQTEKERSNFVKPRPLSWDLTSISLLKNI